ncbi:MAG: alkaline phosphatase [Xanthomonadaceae bacterium]|nr:alkaline phosphatase [Xanthomonadaceae bacterium]
MPASARPRPAFALGLALLIAGSALPARDVRAEAISRVPAIPAIARPAGETPAWWYEAGARAAQRAIAEAGGPAHVRNVIVLLGDGMGFTTVAAAHIFAGQRAGQDGESHRLSFERFPYTALSRTYETNQQTPDSAGTMTAIMTGVKTQAGFIGVDQTARRGDCASARGAGLMTLLELAARAGLATGAVTTTRLTHATPAATYGHGPERNWEVDADLPPEAIAAGCRDFAAQLADSAAADGLDVALGGGRTGFMPAGVPDPQREGLVGQRLDGRDLIAEWRQRPASAYVWNATQLAAVDPARTRHLLGLFNPSHLEYDHDRRAQQLDEPSLAAMTRTAIRVLQGNRRGYVLMVEGGRIDHALHAGNAYRALDETRAFADAVQAAVELAGPDTLIVVTADHSHTLTFAGYPKRGNDILGLVEGPHDSYIMPVAPGMARDAQGRPYTTLGFANGPGYTGASDRQPEGSKHYPHYFSSYSGIHDGRPALTAAATGAPDYLQESVLPLKDETHGGEDVGIWARGPGAAAFHGEFEQNAIFHLIAQQTPAIRNALCRLGACADGVPVALPERSASGPVAR